MATKCHDPDLTHPEPADDVDLPTRVEGGNHEGHLVRLCLDTQLDALLITLGAAAAEECTHHGAPAAPDGPARPRPTESPPWRRWVQEDLELACALASDTITGGGTLPSTLGLDLHRSLVVDSLQAHYQSMTTQLGALTSMAATHGHPGTHQALDRCQHRLAELRQHQLNTATPPSGTPPPTREHHYLPGELLG